MPRAAPSRPRKMLPAPTTIAISTPPLGALVDLVAIAARGRIGAVLERPHQGLARELQQTRLNTGSAIGGNPTGPGRGLLLADREAGEARDLDVLAGLRGEIGAQLLDRLALVPVGADVLLARAGRRPSPTSRAARRRSARSRCRACPPRAPSPRTPARSASRASSGISSIETYCGFSAATWIATSRANSWKPSVRATKSVSHWTSTSTPDLASGVDVGGDDALAGRSPERFAAEA